MTAEAGRRIRRRWMAPVTFVAFAVLVVGVASLSQRAALAAPAQPIAFSHRVHASAGIQCLFCHPNALRSPIAGMPSVQKCTGCHTVIDPDSPEIREVARYWEAGEPIPWARVVIEPDFVFFSHQPHLSAGLNCETCHGDVGRMETARPAGRMDMGWCLNCHLEQPAENVARLTDCLACHQ